MSGKERNSFEKELQKDPFAEEAAEGFDSITADSVSEDLSILKKRINTRLLNKRRYIYYRIAASVAVLMVISTLYIVLNRDHTTHQIAGLTVTEKSESKKEEQPLPALAEDIKTEEAAAVQDNVKRKEAKKQVIVADKIQVADATVQKQDAMPPVSDPVAEIKLNTINAAIAETQAAAPMASRAAVPAQKQFNTGGKVISSEDNLPVPGVIVALKGTNTSAITDSGGNFTISLPDSSKHTLVANFIGMEPKEFAAKADSRTELKLDPDVTSLSEIVVVGYGAKKADNEDYNTPSGYTPPRPVAGRSAFNKYIEENINRPDTSTAGQRAVVVINFTVLLDGSIDSIKIVRSPGKQFSDEAIRLIKSGPKWKPAADNGQSIADEVKMRIIFR